MASSKDNIETFLEEFREEIITGVSSPGGIIEAWISQYPATIIQSPTPQEQMRELFNIVGEGPSELKVVFYQILLQKDLELIADLEQRQHNSKMTQTEQNWTEEEWEETQANREENLKTKTEQQLEETDRQTAEKHEQDLFRKTLRSQVENVIEKLAESKKEATQEKMQLLKMWAEIHQERETLDRRYSEIIEKRHKLEMMKYDKTKSQEGTESQESMEQQKGEQGIMEKLMAGGLLNELNKNHEIMLKAKQEKEEMEKNIADIKQELKRNQMAISQHRDKVEHIKHNMNVMKQRWANIQRGAPMQKAAVPGMDSMKAQWETEMADIQRQKEEFEKKLAQVQSEKDEIESIKIKFILEREKDEQLAKAEMEAMKSMMKGADKQKQELDNLFQMTKKEMRELDVMNTEIEIKKKHLLKMIRMSRRKEEQISKKVRAKQGLEERPDETEVQRSEQELHERCDECNKINIIQHKEYEVVEGDMDKGTNTRINTEIQRLILQVEEIRKMLRTVKEDAEQSSRDFAEEKSQIKWMHFQAKKKRRMLDQSLEKTMKERDELEILKIKIQQQRQEFEQKLKDARRTILTMGEIKTNIQRGSEEINKAREEMLKTQKEMENNQGEVKKYMDKLASMKTQFRSEKPGIEGLTLQFETVRHKLVNVMNMNVIKQREQQLKQDDIKRQTQELQSSKQTLMAEREELELLRKDLNYKKQELEDALKNIKEERDQLSQKESDIDRERDMLLNEQDELKTERSDLKMKEHQLLEKDRFLEILRVKFQQLNKRMTDNITNKFTTLEQQSEGVVTLAVDLEQRHKSLDDQKGYTTFYFEMLKSEKEGLACMLKMIICKEAIQNQLEQELLLEKQDLEALKEGLQEDIGKFEREKNVIFKDRTVINKEKLDFKEITLNIHEQMQSLEVELREEMDKLEITKSDLQTTKEQTDHLLTETESEKIKIQDLTLQADTVKYKLVNVMNMIVLRQKEQQLQQADFNRQTQELQSRQTTLMIEREKLDILRRDLSNDKQEVENDMKIIKKERDQLRQIQSDTDTERDILLNEQHKLKTERSALKMKEHQLLEKEKFLEILKVKLQQLNERMIDNVNDTFNTLEQQNEGAVTLVNYLEQKHKCLDEQKEYITSYSEMLQKEKEGLMHMLQKIIHKEAMQNHLEQQLLLEKKYLETLKEGLKEDIDNLKREKNVISKEKLDFEQMTLNIQDQMLILEKELREKMDKLEITRSDLQMTKSNVDLLLTVFKSEKPDIEGLTLQVETVRHKLVNVMNMNVIKQREQQLKQDDINRQTQELQSSQQTLTAQREELEILSKDLNYKKQELEDALKNIKEERDQLSQKESDIDRERDMLLNEQDGLEAERRELKMKEDQIIEKERFLEILRVKLKHLNNRTTDNITNKITTFEQQSEGVVTLVGNLEQIHKSLDDQKGYITFYSEMLKSEKEGLACMLRMIICKEAIQNQLEQELLLEKQDLEALKEGLQEDIGNFEREKNVIIKDRTVINKEKLDFKEITLNIHEQMQSLEVELREEMDKLEITKSDLQTTKEQTDHLLTETESEKIKIQDLTLQADTVKYKLVNVMNMIVLRQKEQQLQQADFNRQTQELQSRQTTLMIEREKLDILRRDLSNDKREVENDMKIIKKERDQLRQIQSDIDTERDILLNEQHKLKTERSALNMKEHQLLEKEKFLEILKVKLQQLNERMIDNINDTFNTLEQQNEGVVTLVNYLEQKHKCLDEQKEYITSYSEMLQKEKEGLMHMLQMIIHKEAMQNQLEQELLLEKKYLETLKEGLKEDIDNLKREKNVIYKEKLDFEQMTLNIQDQMLILEKELREKMDKLEITRSDLQMTKSNVDLLLTVFKSEKPDIEGLTLQVETVRHKLVNVMNMNVIKQREQQLKQDDINRQTQELQSSQQTLTAQREELEILSKDLNYKKQELEDALKNIKEERDQLSQKESDIEREREMLFNEQDRLEAERRELKMKEDQIIEKERFLEILRVKLKQLNNRTTDNITNKFTTFKQQSEGVVTLVGNLEQIHKSLDDQKGYITFYSEMLKSEKEGLACMLRMIICKEAIQNQLEQELLLEKQDLEALKEGLQEDIGNFKREKNVIIKDRTVINKEKLDFKEITLNIHEQMQSLEVELREEMDKLEITKSDLQTTKEQTDHLLTETESEKIKIQDLTLQADTVKYKLLNVMNMIVLQQKEQQLQQADFNRQTHELQSRQTTLMIEREKLDILRRDLSNDKREVENDMKIIKEERDQLRQIQSDIDTERDILLNEQHKLKTERSALKMKEHQLLEKEKFLEILKVKLQQLNERMIDNVNDTFNTLEQQNEGVVTLVNYLEQKHKCLDEQKEYITSYSEMLQKEKEGLMHMLQMIIHKEAMQNQLEQELLLEKKYLETLKEGLKEDIDNLKREKNVIYKEKLDLEQMTLNIQDQMLILEKELREKMDKLEITRSDLQMTKSNVDLLLTVFKCEKPDIEGLTLQVETVRHKLVNVMNMNVIKQREQQLKQDDINRQTQELQSSQQTLTAQREELDILSKDLNYKEQELEDALKNMKEERDQLSQKESDIDRERDMLFNEQDGLEAERRELKMKEDQIIEKERFLEILRVKLKQLNNRTTDNITNKFTTFKQQSEGVVTLVGNLEQIHKSLDDQKGYITFYSEMLKSEKEGLACMLRMIICKEAIQNQLEQELLLEKQDLEALKEGLQEDIGNFEREKNVIIKDRTVINKEKLDFKEITLNIHEQMQSLEVELREEMDKLEITKSDLQTTKEQTDHLLTETESEKIKIQDLTLQADTVKYKLVNVMNMIVLQQKEQQLQQADFNRQTQELQSRQTTLMIEREKLDILRRDLSNDKREVENDMKIIKEERDQLRQIQSDIDTERDILLNEQHKLKTERSALKMKEHQLLEKEKFLEILKVKLQQLNERMIDNVNDTFNTLEQQNEGVVTLVNYLEQKHKCLDEQKEYITSYSEMLQKEKEGLMHMLQKIIHKEAMQNQLEQELLLEKKYLETLKEGLKEDIDNLKREKNVIYKEKLDFEQMTLNIQDQMLILEKELREKMDKLEITRSDLQMTKSNVDLLLTVFKSEKPDIEGLTLQVETVRHKLVNVMNMNVIKQREQQLKQDDINRQTQELQSSQQTLTAQREELDILSKDLNYKKQELEDALKNIKEERDQLSQKESDIDRERDMLLNEQDGLEAERRELKMKEDQIIEKERFLEILRVKLKQLNNRTTDNITNKFTTFKQQSEGVVTLVGNLEQIHKSLDDQKGYITFYSEMLKSEKEGLACMLRMIICKEAIQNQLEQELLLEKQDLEALKEGLQEDIGNFEREKNVIIKDRTVINKEKLDFKEITLNIHEQMQSLEVELREEMDKLEITKFDLQTTKEQTDHLLTETESEKIKIQDLTLQADTVKYKLVNVMNMIVLQQKEQQLQQADFNRQTQELQSRQTTLMIEREKLDILRRDLSNDKREVENDMKIIKEERDQLRQIQSDIDTERDILLNEQHKLKTERSALKMKEHQLLEKEKFLEILKVKLQQLNERMIDNSEKPDIEGLTLQVETVRHKLVNVMNMNVIKQREQQLKQDDINRQTQELQSSQQTLTAQREELEILSKDLNYKKQELEDALKNIKEERDQLSQKESDIDRERDMLLNEQDGLEAERRELKMKEDQIIEKERFLEILRVKLKQLNNRTTDNITNKFTTFKQQSEGVVTLVGNLEQIHKSLDDQKGYITFYSEMLKSEKEGLACMLRMIICKEAIQNQLEQELLLEKQDLEALKEGLQEDIGNFEREKNVIIKDRTVINKEKLDFKEITLNIHEQMQSLEVELREEMDKLEITKSDLQTTKEQTDHLLTETESEKIKIQDLTLQADTVKYKLVNVMNMIVLQQKEQQLQQADFNRQTQELQSRQTTLMIEREKLDILRKDLSNDKREVENDMKIIKEERDQLRQIQSDIDTERDILLNEQHKLKTERSALKMKEHQLLEKEKFLEILKVKLQQLNERMIDNVNDTFNTLEQQNEGVVTLVNYLEQKHKCLDEQKESITSYSEMLQKEKEGLMHMVQMIIHKEAMQNQLEQQLLLEKKYLETLKEGLKEDIDNLKREKNVIYKEKLDFEQMTLNIQDQMLILEKELREKMDKLEITRTVINKEKLDFKEITLNIHEQMQSLEVELREEMDKLEITKSDLQTTKEQTDHLLTETESEKIKIQDLTLQADTVKYKLLNVMNMIVLQQKEQQLQQADFNRQTQELQSRQTTLMIEREKLDILRKDLSNDKREVENDMKIIKEERDQLRKIQSDIDTERDILLNEQHKLKTERSALKMKEHQLLEKEKFLEILKVKLQQLNERMIDNVNDKFNTLEQQNEGVVTLVNYLEQKHKCLDEQKESITSYSEMLQKEKEGLMHMVQMIIHKEAMQNQLEQQLLLEKKYLETLKEGLKEDIDNLKREKNVIYKEKLDFEQMTLNIQDQMLILEKELREKMDKLEITRSDLQMTKSNVDLLLTVFKSEKPDIEGLTLQVETVRHKLVNVMNMNVIKQREQQLKQDDINRQTQELQSSQQTLTAQREELEILSKDLNYKKQELEDALKNIKEERDQLSQRESDIDRERDMLLNEQDGLEAERRELKMKEDQIIEKDRFLEILRVKLKHLNNRTTDNITNKFTTFEQQSEGVVTLVGNLEQIHKSLDDQKGYITFYSEMLKSEKEGLACMLRMIICKEAIQNQLEQELLLEKQDLEALKEGLQEDIGNFEREKNVIIKDRTVINKEKLDFKEITLNIHEQMQSLELELREEMDKLEITKSDLQTTKEQTDHLLTETESEKIKIQDLTLQADTVKYKLLNVMNMIVLQQKEQQLQQADFNRQTQELQSRQTTLMIEREKLDILRKDLSNDKREVENDMKIIKEERDQLRKIQSDIDTERDILLNEQHKLKTERSALKMKEHQLLEKEKFLEILKVKLQQLNERMIDNVNDTFNTLEQQNEGVVTLVNYLEQKHKCLDEQKESITSYSEMLQKEKEGLMHMLQMIIHKEAMQNQLEQQLLLEKKYLETLKEGLKEDIDNLKREKNVIYKEKLDFEQMTLNIQDQMLILEKELREKMDKLEITRSDLQMTKSNVDLLLTVFKSEKPDIEGLTLQVETVRHKLVNIMNMNVIKQREQQLKQDDINRQTQELQSSQQTLTAQREELEILSKDLNYKKQELEDALKNIKEERDQLSQRESDIDRERDMLLNEQDGLEAERRELKMKEDQIIEKERFLEILRVKLKQLNNRTTDNITNKFTTFKQQSEGVVTLVGNLEQIHKSLDDQKGYITFYSEMLKSEKEGLACMLRMIICKEAIQNQLEQELLLEKQDLEALKEGLQEDIGNFEREKNVIIKDRTVINKEKLDFKEITLNIHEQMQSLELELREEMDKLEITKSDLQTTKEQTDHLLTETESEKIKIQDLTLQADTVKYKLLNVMNMIVLQQKEQQLQQADFNRQTQELQSRQTTLMIEREKLDILRKDLSNDKREVENDMKIIKEERDQLRKIQSDIDTERDILLNEQHKLKTERSALKMKEHQLLEKEKFLEILKVKLQQLNERMIDNVNDKFNTLEQQNEGVVTLVNYLEQKHKCLDEQKESITSYSEMLQKEKEGLMHMQDLEALKEGLQEDIGNFEREKNVIIKDRTVINKEKLDFKEITLNIHEQMQSLEVELREEMDKLEITKSDLQTTKEQTDHLLTETESEKIKIQDLTLQADTVKYKLLNVMNMIVLQQKEQQLQQADFNRQTQELQSRQTTLMIEREKLDILRKDLSNDKREVENDMKIIKEERDQLRKIQSDIDTERDILLNEQHKLKTERSALKMKEHQLLEKEKFLEILKVKLQQLNERMIDNVNDTFNTLEQQNEGVVTLVNYLEQKHKCLDEQKESITSYSEMLQKEKEGLMHMVQMIIHKEAMQNQLEQQLLLEKKYLETLKEGLKEDIDNLKRETNVIYKEKLDFEQMTLNIQDQMLILEKELREKMDKLEITKSDLEMTKDHAGFLLTDIKSEKPDIEGLSLQVETVKRKLVHVMNTIVLTQEEQHLKNDDLQRKTQDLHSSQQTVMAERGKLELLRRDLNKKKQELEDVMMNITLESDQLSQMKSDITQVRDMLMNEQDGLEAERRDLKMKEDQIIEKERFLEILRVKLKQLNNRTTDNITEIFTTFEQQSEAVVTLVGNLEQIHKSLDDQKGYITFYSEMLKSEKEGLTNIRRMIIHKEALQNQLEQQLLLEKQYHETLNKQVKEDISNLKREKIVVNKDKLDFEQMTLNIQDQMLSLEKEIREKMDKLEITKSDLQMTKSNIDLLLTEFRSEKPNIEGLTLQFETVKRKLVNVMNTIVLKQEEQHLKDDDLQRKTQDLHSSQQIVMAERGKLELLRRDLNKKKQELEDVMMNITLESDQLSQMKSDITQVRDMLLNEQDGLEAERCKLKMKEDQIIEKEKFLEILRVKLKQLNNRTTDNITNKFTTFKQQSEGVVTLVGNLEQIHKSLDDQKGYITFYSEMLKSEKEGLACMLRMIICKEAIQNQLEQELLLEKQDLEALKEGLQEDIGKFEREKNVIIKDRTVINKEKLDFKEITLNIHEQMQSLEVELREEMDKLEITKSDLQTTKEQTDHLLTETESEKIKIQDLTLQADTVKYKLVNVMNMIVLQQKEQQLQQADFNRQTQELQSRQTTLMIEREKLDILRRDLSNDKREVENDMKIIKEERDQLRQIQSDIDTERDILLNEQHKLKTERSALKMKEHQLLEKEKFLEILKVKLQQLNERMIDNVNDKFNTLEQQNEGVVTLVNYLEQKHKCLDEQKESITSYSEMLQKEKEGLMHMLQKIIHKEAMQNQLEQELLLEKKYLETLKEGLKEDIDNLKREKNVIYKEKLDFEQMTLNIQDQMLILEKKS
ncbi:hypothetical protein Q5P01_019967 [Channa striata]|uniref:Uncharacterized protein n=1 Tax=Channa striata TaxID=64152 RepID=A0AA88M540_CHASR|nr:hypothetical protein Q5P01_019967 [Channa striata]